ncbi:MAG TPA: hypothetical protein DIW81_24280 [Planctomycetaceae bacterium]|uniref:hypothetical protein n=1 Tax=Rubinisphaera sp. TaxID=2024857 RepID=UPI000C0FFDF5|nr:hypothetical protein [Rubinisphaera sp.]MBV09222.1 hypothetical protein [Rubinisphaera sp.]HCS54665.1 hypothetical protein [Planctomycetaceae bacterium]|tara:strand:- start:3058 stop:3399 length:342 start_codon:yes stop_codon:yes gene_type:complete
MMSVVLIRKHAIVKPIFLNSKRVPTLNSFLLPSNIEFNSVRLSAADSGIAHISASGERLAISGDRSKNDDGLLYLTQSADGKLLHTHYEQFNNRVTQTFLNSAKNQGMSLDKK